MSKSRRATKPSESDRPSDTALMVHFGHHRYQGCRMSGLAVRWRGKSVTYLTLLAEVAHG